MKPLLQRVGSVSATAAIVTIVTSAVVAASGLVGCASTGRLAEYDFRNATVAVVAEFPPYPEVLTGPYFPGHPEDPVHALMRFGGRLAKEIEAEDLRPRLDAAAELVDVAARVSARTMERIPRYLGARATADESTARFIVEVVVRDYGVDAAEWLAAAHFFVDARVFIIEAETGVQVWEAHVRERDPITPHIFGPGTVVRDIVTARAFAQLEVEDIARALERLADYSADHIADRLRDALDEVRSEGR